VAARAIRAARLLHGRLLVLDREAAAESTGHGSPLPLLKHGGPGRAGGGEELGGLRAVKHYLQRAAVQGSPTMLAAVTGEYVRGAPRIETGVHPFRRHFEDLQIGESLLTHRRTVGEADIVATSAASRATTSTCTSTTWRPRPAVRQAHRARLLRAVGGGRAVRLAGARAGAGQLRAGHAALRQAGGHRRHHPGAADLQAQDRQEQARRQGRGQGVVAWDVEVTNQHGELVASYDILTLVAKRG
jgi:oxepin-CoA hydrolase/3-oxo-5,6-dehydrosuberyl-CoA semialdehyde dehydrogenase